ncbi:MAG: hypothetical protein WC549_09515 [Actinomycetota bacterium]
MEATTEFIKCDIGVNEIDFGCWPMGNSSKKEENYNCEVTTAKNLDICKKIEKEAKVPINSRRQNLKKPDIGHVNSYQHQVWSLPLYAARRNINGFF